jgi:hypothetical protein
MGHLFVGRDLLRGVDYFAAKRQANVMNCHGHLGMGSRKKGPETASDFRACLILRFDSGPIWPCSFPGSETASRKPKIKPPPTARVNGSLSEVFEVFWEGSHEKVIELGGNTVLELAYPGNI